MNIHEHQAKEILKKYGAPVPKGFVVLRVEDIESKIKKLKKLNLAVKAQIHAGGRGKAGGIKIVKSISDLKKQVKNLFGKKLITPHTGPQGREI